MYKIWFWIKVRLFFWYLFFIFLMGWIERISLILLGFLMLVVGLDKIIELCFVDWIIDIILWRGKLFVVYKLGD